MSDFITALGLLLAVEGLLLAIFPQAMQRAMRAVSESPLDMLRTAGIVGAVIGVGIVYVMRKWLL